MGNMKKIIDAYIDFGNLRISIPDELSNYTD
jgi:hypothetical protein